VSITARIIANETPLDRRRGGRIAVDLEAKLRELGNTGAEARVLNLSATGFMAETDAELSVGARVWLMLPGRDRANAVIRWTSSSGRLGGEFAEPIDLSPLAR
jgi:hypothetical protein